MLPFGAGANSSNRHTIVDAMLCDGHACQDVSLWVWDGDSFTIRNGAGGREKIRIENIDAPKIDAPCAAERAAALQAKDELTRQMSGRRIEVVRGKLGRYGRLLARISVNQRDIGETLVKHGLVRPWDGRRKPWCQ